MLKLLVAIFVSVFGEGYTLSAVYRKRLIYFQKALSKRVSNHNALFSQWIGN